MKKKIIFILILIVLLAVCLVWGAVSLFKPNQKTNIQNIATTTTQNIDAQKFKAEYSGVADDNHFVYAPVDEVINMLKSGTGLIYFGFPECPWCQRYSIYLDEVARSEKLEKVYYYNVRQIRASSTPEYQEIVKLLGDNLDKDQDGNPRIFVPDVVAVKDGKVVGHDNTSSLNTSADGAPAEWWTEERVNTLKEKLKKIIEKVNVCESTCSL